MFKTIVAAALGAFGILAIASTGHAAPVSPLAPATQTVTAGHGIEQAYYRRYHRRPRHYDRRHYR